MKKINIMIMTIAMVLFGMSGFSLAGHHYHGCGYMKISEMSELDTDNDGFMSFEEFSAPKMEKYRSWFNAIDTDGDGSLSQEEWDAFRNAHGYGDKYEG